MDSKSDKRVHKKTIMVGTRVDIQTKLELEKLGKESNCDPSQVIREFILEGIAIRSSNRLVNNSGIDKNFNDLKDFISESKTKSDHRIGSLLSNILITSYEIKAQSIETLKLIVNQIYNENATERILEEINKRVNTEAIVKIKSKKKPVN